MAVLDHSHNGSVHAVMGWPYIGLRRDKRRRALHDAHHSFGVLPCGRRIEINPTR